MLSLIEWNRRWNHQGRAWHPLKSSVYHRNRSTVAVDLTYFRRHHRRLPQVNSNVRPRSALVPGACLPVVHHFVEWVVVEHCYFASLHVHFFALQWAARRHSLENKTMCRRPQYNCNRLPARSLFSVLTGVNCGWLGVSTAVTMYTTVAREWSARWNENENREEMNIHE